MVDDPVSLAEGILNYRFSDGELLRRALTHGSKVGQTGTGYDYQRLEFLGDSVLELLTREYLLGRFPEEPEGKLTQRKIRIVQKHNLAVHGMRLGLDGIAIVGNGFVVENEARRSLAADLIESVIGAIYTDSGLESARKFVRREILDRADHADPGPDARSRLQEYCQARGIELPEYRMIEKRGPEHAPVFMVTVSLEGREIGSGSGHTRKAAREEAATMALENIERMV
jgi:ribonuclease III